MHDGIRIDISTVVVGKTPSVLALLARIQGYGERAEQIESCRYYCNGLDDVRTKLGRLSAAHRSSGEEGAASAFDHLLGVIG